MGGRTTAKLAKVCCKFTSFGCVAKPTFIDSDMHAGATKSGYLAARRKLLSSFSCTKEALTSQQCGNLKPQRDLLPMPTTSPTTCGNLPKNPHRPPGLSGRHRRQLLSLVLLARLLSGLPESSLPLWIWEKIRRRPRSSPINVSITGAKRNTIANRLSVAECDTVRRLSPPMSPRRGTAVWSNAVRQHSSTGAATTDELELIFRRTRLSQ